MTIHSYQKLFLDFLRKSVLVKEPKGLYEPEIYILQLGGKRLRPILSLLATDAFNGKPKEALPAALAVEVFHNFTLLHDDIMDQAEIRRGKPTVHKKWDINTGILSGDVMLINAYQYLEAYPAKTFKDLLVLFSKTAVEVCEGQQYDMDFERREEVSLEEYLKMIKYKTSVLVAAALQIGAIVANAPKIVQKQLYDFGIALGLAFQLQDDYLDTFGNQKTFGKKIGGDILENKKTWLYLKTRALANTDDLIFLTKIYSSQEENLLDDDKIKKVRLLYEKYSIDKAIKKEIARYSSQALSLLDKLDMNQLQKSLLRDLVKQLEERNQ